MRRQTGRNAMRIDAIGFLQMIYGAPSFNTPAIPDNRGLSQFRDQRRQNDVKKGGLRAES